MYRFVLRTPGDKEPKKLNQKGLNFKILLIKGFEFLRFE